VVDDQETVLDIIRRMLEQLAYRVVTAADGEEARAILALSENQVDLIVTDLVMPRMGGRELLGMVLRSQPETPVIAMSGYSTQSEEALVTEGFFAFLAKPFRIDELSFLVKAALDSRPGRLGPPAYDACAMT
jgi:CheY-like chemotaxis protein